MFFRMMDKERLGDLVVGMSTEYEVVGPVSKDERFVYSVINDPQELRLDHDTTLLSPKKYFLPPEEHMMRFRVADHEVIDDKILAVPRAIFGMRPCDINAMLLLDDVFLKDYEDPYYKARREATLIIGASCTPDEACFCNTWSTDEVHWGFDLFLSDLGDRFFVSVRSVRGAELLDRHVVTTEITDEDTHEFQGMIREFKNSFVDKLDTSQLPLLMDAKFNSPVWDELGERCLSCGACSMVCPTCSCFDVKDDLEPDQRSGTRTRTWDSCMFNEFSAVAHGQTFRETRASRVKYRYYHKQLGYLSKHERVLCVGCGRCARACLAAISPREVITSLVDNGADR